MYVSDGYCFLPSYTTSMSDHNAAQSQGQNFTTQTPPLPAVVLPALNQATIFLAGFRDCTEEAIKYLVDVENISKDDPLIQGLQMHLHERQDNIDVAKIVSDSESDRESQYSGSRTTSESEGGHSPQQGSHDSDMDSGLERSAIEDGLDSSLSLAEPTLSLPTNQLTCAFGPADIGHMAGPHDPISSGQHHILSTAQSLPGSHETMSSFGSHIPSHVTLGEPHGHQSPTSKDSFPGQVDLSTLAQNNPIVANLTKELFELLDGDLSDESEQAISTETTECFRGHDEIFGRDSPMAHE